MKVTVIGLGYVGSVAAAALASSGHEVLGVDISREKIEAFNNRTSPIFEPGLSDLLSRGMKSGNLRFSLTDDVSGPLGDVILIATGTPTGTSGGADLRYVKSALEWAKGNQPEGGVILMKSTVPPGTGVRLAHTILKGSSLEYVSNPEFLREGQALNDWFNPDRMVIGTQSESAVNVVKQLYKGINTPCVVTDITSAEMIKYAANAFLATRISFINEIAALCDRVGALIDDVSEGISYDPRIGASFLRAGVGYGGSCFPKDVRALDHLALTNDHNFELLRSVITVNNRQRHLPLYALRQRFGNLDGLRVGVFGLAFKPGTDDVREAPSLDLINVLVEEGVDVTAFDPKAGGSVDGIISSEVSLVNDPIECASRCHALVLMTEWPEIVNADWMELSRCASPPRFLFDGRNALDSVKMRSYGFEYVGVGRSVSRSSD